MLLDQPRAWSAGAALRSSCILAAGIKLAEELANAASQSGMKNRHNSINSDRGGISTRHSARIPGRLHNLRIDHVLRPFFNTCRHALVLLFEIVKWIGLLVPPIFVAILGLGEHRLLEGLAGPGLEQETGAGHGSGIAALSAAGVGIGTQRMNPGQTFLSLWLHELALPPGRC